MYDIVPRIFDEPSHRVGRSSTQSLGNVTQIESSLDKITPLTWLLVTRTPSGAAIRLFIVIHHSVIWSSLTGGARCRSVVRAFVHDAIGRRIDPTWWTH